MIYKTVLGKGRYTNDEHSISNYLKEKWWQCTLIPNFESFETKATDLWPNSENKFYLPPIYSSLYFKTVLILDYE